VRIGGTVGRLAALIAVLGALGVGMWRLSRTAEWRAAFGTVQERADLCRTLPGLSSRRRARLLARFLADPAEDVLGSAITAWERSPDADEFRPRILAILRDPSMSGPLRTKAGLALLGGSPPDAGALAFVEDSLADPAFRRDCPRLVAAHAEVRLPQMSEPDRLSLLHASLDDADPAREALSEMVRRQVGQFASFHEEFLARLEEAPDSARRRHLTACLAALAGGLRGQSVEDWRQDEVSEAAAGELHAVEAEWAGEITPNYQIDSCHDAFGLMLGEGAGGVLSWLRGHDGTVDVGTARLPFFAPADGAYTLWARVWLSDKCGNSFGIWLDKMNFSNFPDYSNVLSRWHWLELEPAGFRLAAGDHEARLEAWEDDVFLDKFALLPVGVRPDSLPEKAAVRWRPGGLPSLSFTPEFQAQARGTTQRVVVWLRRQTPTMEEGTLEVAVPPPFELDGEHEVALRFEKGNPLVRTSFYLRLPADAVGYEGILRAVYRDRRGDTVDGEMILTAQFDWLTSGPLAPDSPLHARLAQGPAEASPAGWQPYPVSGYDRYRRLAPEQAYGQLQDRYLYFHTELDVTADGTYWGLLTADDWARVWLDGRLVIGQPHAGPGEGRLVQAPIPISAGRHRLFVQLYQMDFPDPAGGDAGRHSYNNCNLKLLLRQSRHVPAPQIRGLPRRPAAPE